MNMSWRPTRPGYTFRRCWTVLNLPSIAVLLLCSTATVAATVSNKPSVPAQSGLIEPFSQRLAEIKKFNDATTQPANNKYVIGGTAVASGEFRNVVALLDNTNKAFCTATFVTPNTLVTAGHCIYYLHNPNLPHFNILRQWQQANDGWTVQQNISTYLHQLSQDMNALIKLEIDGVVVEQVVQHIAVDPSWQQLNLLLAQYYLSDDMVMPVRLPFSDRAIITLNKNFNDIELIPLLSDNELSALQQHFAAEHARALNAVQVGFGLREDPAQLAETMGRFELKKALKKLTGEKYQVLLPLHGIWQGQHGLRAAIGSEGKAACYGDSGGPTFIELTKGQWRYVANLSSGLDGARCGQAKADFWPPELTQLQLATDIVDVWH